MKIVSGNFMLRISLNILTIGLAVCLLLSLTNELALKSTKANAFKVIKVNGKIIFVKTGANLRTGDAYLEGTPLSFSSNKDRAAIVNKIKGRFILQPNQKGKPTVLPATSNIASRGNPSVLLNMLDIQNYFSDTCVIIGDMKITLGKEAFPLDEEKFFYLTYNHDGEQIAKKINSDNQNLMISEDEIFEIDNNRIPTFMTEMSVYYMTNGKSKKVGQFTPIFPSRDVLKSEIEVLLSEIEEHPVDKKMEEVATFVIEFYGKPQKDNLNDWLYETFDLEDNKEINFK